MFVEDLKNLQKTKLHFDEREKESMKAREKYKENCKIRSAFFFDM